MSKIIKSCIIIGISSFIITIICIIVFQIMKCTETIIGALISGGFTIIAALIGVSVELYKNKHTNEKNSVRIGAYVENSKKVEVDNTEVTTNNGKSLVDVGAKITNSNNIKIKETKYEEK